VQIDPATVLFADHDAAQNRLVLSGEVIAPADKASACELLLRYNNEWKTTGGVRMSLDSDDVVIQIGDVSTVDLDARKLAGTIQTFTGILRGWRDMLGRKATGTPDDAIDLAGQGFIRG
jgi:hypothetical protein